MALQRAMCGVSILQMVLSLVTLGMCSTQYYTADFTKTTVPHVAVYFLLRALPLINLLMCGIIGIVSSCLNNKSARAVYITLTTQTSISLVVLVWYFSYWVAVAPMQADRDSSGKCLGVTVLSLTTCLGYLLYELINFLLNRSKISDQTKIDIESGSDANAKQAVAVVERH